MKFLYKNQGVSTIIATLIMIVLVLVSTVIVFNLVLNLTQENVESSEACFGNFGKITIGNSYTCYNSTSNEIQFLISIEDVDVDDFLVSISDEGSSQSFKFSDGISSFVREYDSIYGNPVAIPNKNSGKTYVVDLDSVGLTGVGSISIAPIINGNQCEVSDSINQVDNCLLLS